jgi:transposase
MREIRTYGLMRGCWSARLARRTGVYSTDDGRLAIDNNRAENQLRLVAVGRKNWLFAGSFEGARRAALLYSLVQSCKLIAVPPFAYVKDVLRRLPTHPHRLIDQLTPRGWAKTFGPAA